MRDFIVESYRGWDIHTENWCYGWLLPKMHICNCWDYLPNNYCYEIIESYAPDINMYMEYHVHKVDKDSIGQMLKFPKGKIYTGDIVIYNNKKYTVKINEVGFILYNIEETIQLTHEMLDTLSLEVIGNEWENVFWGKNIDEDK